MAHEQVRPHSDLPLSNSRETKTNSDHKHTESLTETFFHAPAEEQQDIQTPCITGFRILLACIAVLPTLFLFCVAVAEHYLLNRDISFFGLITLSINFVPLMVTSTVTQVFFGLGIKPQILDAQPNDVENNTKAATRNSSLMLARDREEDGLEDGAEKMITTPTGGYTMTSWEKIHWIQLTLACCVVAAFLPALLFPIGWWTYVFGAVFIVFIIIIFIIVIYWTAPALKKAIYLNLNTQAALQRFQEKLMVRFFGSILFQVFILTFFIYPALKNVNLPAEFAGPNITFNMYAANGAPMFVQFALPSWWHGVFLSICFGLGPLMLTLVEGSGTFEAGKSTGKFSNRIATVMILWYLIILCGVIQLPVCISPQDDIVKLSHSSILDGLHTGWNSISNLFFLALSVAPFNFAMISIYHLRSIAKMTEDLKGGNTWHFFISHYQANGGDQCAVLSSQLASRGKLVILICLFFNCFDLITKKKKQNNNNNDNFSLCFSFFFFFFSRLGSLVR